MAPTRAPSRALVALVALVAVTAASAAHAHAHAHGSAALTTSAREVLHAVAASALVSLASLAACALIPMRVIGVRVNMEALSQLAIGAMAAEALGHQLPSAYASASGDDGVVASGVVAGILAFHVVECVVRARKTTDDENNDGEERRGRAPRRGAKSSSRSKSRSKSGKTKTRSFAHIAPTGWLNLIADAVHNFTDGIAIAIAFARRGVSAGWRTAIAVLAHELPQEIGDFSILRVAGFSDIQALGFNLLSATVAIAGTVLTFILLALSESAAFAAGGASAAFAEAFAAGGFLAVIFAALADIARENHPQRDRRSAARVILIPTLRVFAGFVASLVLERHLHGRGDHHHGDGRQHHHHHHHHH